MAKSRSRAPALVTGAAGLIGSAVARALLNTGTKVRGLVRPASRTDSLESLDVDIVRGDVLAPESLEPAMEGVACVFHTATYFAYQTMPAEELEHLAVQGTLNVLHAAARAGVRRVVLTSSSVVFGFAEAPAILDERSGWADSSTDGAYVRSKIAQDAGACLAAQQLGLELVIACPTITIGPHPLTLGPSNGLISSYLADPLRLTFGGGCNLVSADDIGRGHVLLAARGAPGEHYLLGSENLTWPEIHAMISDMTGTSGPHAKLGAAASYVAAIAAELQSAVSGRPPLSTREQARMAGRYYWYSHAKAASLGYDPQPVRPTLARTISWLVASPHVSRETRANLKLGAEVYAARRAIRGALPARSSPP